MSGFFSSLRDSHPIKLGTIFRGKRVIETFNRSEDNDIWGRAWALFDDGTEMLADDIIEGRDDEIPPRNESP